MIEHQYINRQLDTMSIPIELNRYDWISISNILWILVCENSRVLDRFGKMRPPRLIATQKLKRSGHGSHTWVHIEDNTGDGCWDMLSNYWIHWGRIASMYSVHFLLVALHSSPLFFPSILRWFHRSSFTASQPLPAASWSVTGYKQLDSNPRMPCLGRSGKAAGGTFGDFQKFLLC